MPKNIKRQKFFHNLDSQSTRLAYLRHLSGLTRNQIQEQFDVPKTSIFYWESAKSTMRKTSLSRMVEVYNQLGIPCTYAWLAHGEGSPPGQMPLRDNTSTSPPHNLLNIISSKNAEFISYLSTDEVFLYVNNKYTELFNCPVNKIIGNKLKDMIGEQGYIICKPYINRALAGDEISFEYPWEYQDKQFRYLKLTYVPHKDQYNEVVGIYTLINDTANLIDLHTTGSNIPDLSEFLPDIGQTNAPYNHQLFIDSLGVTQAILEKYKVVYLLTDITKIAMNIYYEGLRAQAINHSYAESIIKIILKAGILGCNNKE